MSDGDRSPFVRSVGDVVLDSFQPASFVTGLVLASPLLAAALVGTKGASHFFFNACVLALVPLTMFAQSRLAMNAFAGDSTGGLFSETGGSIGEVLPVAVRLFTLSFLWSIPFAVAIWKWEPDLRSVQRLPFLAAAPPPTFLILYLGATVIAPFFFLAAAVAASGFGEIFTGGLWSGLFGSRLGEVVLMVVATFGAPVAIVVIVAPWGASLALKAPDLARFLTGMAFLYALGVTLSIQSRLCGSFAAAVLLGAVEESVPEPVRPPGTPSAPAAVTPVPTAVAEQIREAWAAFPTDQADALARMADLAAGPSPDARVLHALALMTDRAGDAPGSVETARRAIPVCLKAGEEKLASEIYRLHAAEAKSLLLDASQLVALGDAFLAQNDPSAASNAWANALTVDPVDRKAFKGLLKVADQILQSGATLDRAIRIYDFLLQAAPGSPFADHARAQAEIARRKAAKG